MTGDSDLKRECAAATTSTPEGDTHRESSHHIFSSKEAERLVTKALDTEPDEPENLVRLLLALHDNTGEPRLSDSIYLLMKMAYNNSLVHSIDFQEYLEAIREGRNILEEARSRGYDEQA